MKTLVSIVFCTAVLSSFYSCGICSKSLDCEAFNDSITNNWFPYKNGQSISFANQTGGLLQLRLQVDSSVKQTKKAGGYSPKLFCDNFKNISSAEQDSTGSLFKIDVNNSANNNDSFTQRYTYFKLGTRTVSAYDLTSTGFSSALFNQAVAQVQNFQNYNFNGRVYAYAQSFYRDTTADHAGGLYKLTVVKGLGIVSYETNPGAVKWTLQ